MDGNNEVLQDVLKSVATQSSDMPDMIRETEKNPKKTLNLDYQRLTDCFLQIVREWTTHGEQERKDCFDLILNELCAMYPDEETREDICVFVPGCGLARLPFEIAKAGFQSVGNECDFFQLFVGSFIMNEITRKDNYRFYPFIHDLKNRMNMNDVTTPIPFPDINPSDRSENFQFQMLPGEFLKIAEDEIPEGSLDVIVTTFFLDSGHNILDYIDAIAKLLKPEGIWINFGALNFKSDLPMSLEMMKQILSDQYNFEFLKDETITTSYGQSQTQNSMFHMNLQCAFFTCKKNK